MVQKNKAKVEIAQLWLYSYIQILSNNFSRLLPIFFVPPTTAEKAIYSEGLKTIDGTQKGGRINVLSP